MTNSWFKQASAAQPANRSIVRLGLLICAFLALSAPVHIDETSAPEQPRRLDLSQFMPSFREDFDSLDVSDWGCLSRWIAHTPWAGDFGDSTFMAPGERSPFAISDGILSIGVRRVSDDKWESGMLSSWSRCNGGFAQKYGYFEIRTKLPSGPGFWPAFWLIGVDRSEGTAEVDIFEYYPHRPDKLEFGLHKHSSGPGDEHVTLGMHHNVEPGTLSEDFHTYGAELTKDEVIFYLDREEVWRTPAPRQFRQPVYILVSLATQKYRINGDTPDSATMEIDYIHAYQRKPIGL